MKLKILFALVIVTLVAGQVAYGQGYNVRRASTPMDVAQYANNAMVSNLTFMRATSGDDNNINDPTDTAETLTIKIGYGLVITNDDAATGDATAPFVLWCGAAYDTVCQPSGGDAAAPSATVSNKGGEGVITITIGTTPASFRVAGVRVDASALALGSEISASITSTTDATTVPLDGAATTGGVSGVVGKVAAGLKVTAEKDAALACAADDPMPSITVAEGFGNAWATRLNLDEVGGAAGATGAQDVTASVKIVLSNLPDGAKVEWRSPISSMITIGENDHANGTLTLNPAESSSNGRVAVYDYTRITTYDATPEDTADTDADFSAEQNAMARSFKITPSGTTFMGDASVDIAAMLHPNARRGTDGEKLNLDTELSFEAMPQAPEKGNGEGWLVISECVTYLLYPFITCGATPGWSTGVSVSNTTADGNVFGAFDNTVEQMGPVVMYGFPRGQAAPAEGMMVEPVVSTVSANLMAGDTVTFDCGATTMAGMEGYAIVRAGFQHARGMAFVLGNFSDGAAVDVSHGYMAEVIDDPNARNDALP